VVDYYSRFVEVQRLNTTTSSMVKTVKALMENSTDPYMALLSYHATPMPWCGLSSAELLMGRKIWTDLPQTTASLMPQWSHVKNFRTQYKRSQKSIMIHATG